MAKYFMCIISFNSHNDTTKFVPLVYTFFSDEESKARNLQNQDLIPKTLLLKVVLLSILCIGKDTHLKPGALVSTVLSACNQLGDLGQIN